MWGSNLYLSLFSFIISSLAAAIFKAMMRLTDKGYHMRDNKWHQYLGDNHYASLIATERNHR